MQVRAVLEHFLSQADWVDRTNTVDRVIWGDAGRDVTRCAVVWISSLAAIRAAVALGAELLITHEPTFWNHRDEAPEANPHAAEKIRLLDETGMVVLRNHDCWDRWPEVGIPWAWARFLGLGQTPSAVGAAGYQHRYDIEACSVNELAHRIARKTQVLGESMVQVIGDPHQVVQHIGSGTGCACGIETYLEMGCDCSIVCDDGSCYWAGIQQAQDIGHPVIRVNHGTSEEPGMISLAAYINEHLDGLEAEHIPHGSTFRLVGELHS